MRTPTPSEHPFLDRDVRRALFQWALGYLDGGAHAKAERILSELAVLARNDPMPRAAAALSAMLSGNIEAAEDHLLDLRARFPTTFLVRRISKAIKNRRKTACCSR